MFDFSKKVEVTNDLCAAIICIAYPSMMSKNRDKAEPGGIDLPGKMITSVKLPFSKDREYFVKQDVVNQIRSHIKQIQVELYAAYGKIDPLDDNLNYSLLIKAIEYSDIAAQTRWTEGHYAFGAERLSSDSLLSSISIPEDIDNRFLDVNFFGESEDSLSSSLPTLNPEHKDQDDLNQLDLMSMTLEPDLSSGIQVLESALPSNDAARAVIERFTTLVDLGYPIEVAVRPGHVLVKSFCSDNRSKLLGQVFIDSSSGLITSEY
jgi:hypothetical protein